MKNKAEVSVIIPVYNLSRWIEKCVRSVLEQTVSNIEIIVVDDGSKDDSYEIVKGIQEEHPEKIILLSQENSGQAAARNRALDTACGKYIVFVDGDDYIEPTYIQCLLEKIENENLDCVVCGYERVDEHGNVIQRVCPDTSNEMYQMKFLAACSKIFRLSYLREKNIRFPEGKLYEDVSFSWQVMFLSNKIGVIDCVGYKYLMREGSSSNSKVRIEKVPFEENSLTIQKIMSEIDEHKKELFIYSILTQYAYLVFVLPRKNSLNIVKEMSKRLAQDLKENIPTYWKNSYIKATVTKKTIPFVQRMAIRLLVSSTRCNLLTFTAILFTRL